MTREKETIRQRARLRVKTILEGKDQDLLVFKRQAVVSNRVGFFFWEYCCWGGRQRGFKGEMKRIPRRGVVNEKIKGKGRRE